MTAIYNEPDKPDDGVEFIKRTIGAPTKEEQSAMFWENDALIKNVAALEKELAEVKAQLPAPAPVE